MKLFLTSVIFVGAIAAASVFAAAPAGAPSGSMGMCNDGSYSTSAEKKGACRGHKGVKDWYAADSTMSAPPSKAESNKPPATSTASAAPSKRPTTAAAGGAPGMVWGNESSKVYHCSGDKWYGKTKHGAYMSEADAKSKGFHADHGKACAS